jgi:hypothetical protein
MSPAFSEFIILDQKDEGDESRVPPITSSNEPFCPLAFNKPWQLDAPFLPDIQAHVSLLLNSVNRLKRFFTLRQR